MVPNCPIKKERKEGTSSAAMLVSTCGAMCGQRFRYAAAADWDFASFFVAAFPYLLHIFNYWRKKYLLHQTHQTLVPPDVRSVVWTFMVNSHLQYCPTFSPFSSATQVKCGVEYPFLNMTESIVKHLQHQKLYFLLIKIPIYQKVKK